MAHIFVFRATIFFFSNPPSQFALKDCSDRSENTRNGFGDPKNLYKIDGLALSRVLEGVHRVNFFNFSFSAPKFSWSIFLKINNSTSPAISYAP